MDDIFKCIYKILKTLKISMDYDEVDTDQISAQALGITKNKWLKIMEMLVQNGYIQGISVKCNDFGKLTLSESNIRITLKGLEYLSENSLMKRAYNVAKGIKETVPKI